MSAKVLFLVSQIGGIGGIQRFNRNFLNALNDNACNVDVLSYHDSEESISALEKHVNTNYVICNKSKLRFAINLFSLLLRNNYDRYICGHVNLLPMLFLFKVFFHEIRGKDYLIMHGIEVWNRLTGIQKAAVWRLHRILSVSKYTKDNLLAQVERVRQEDILIFPNTIGKYQQGEINDEATPSNPEAKFIILSVTRLDRSEVDKGIAHVISALTRLPKEMNFEYRIVGDGNYRADLEALAASKGVSGHVKFLGPISDSELWLQYHSADAFVLTSKKEGFGIVFLEAMRHRLPVIGAAEKGILDVIIPGKNGLLVKYGDESEISASLEKLYMNPPMRAAMASAGYSMVSGDGAFSYASFKNRLGEYLRL